MSTSGLLQVFLENRAALQRYLVMRGAAEEEAEDVLQDMSVKLTTDTIGAIAQPRAYLYRMATNHLMLHRRSRTRSGQRDGDWARTHGLDAHAVDQAPSANRHLIAREQLALLNAALARLPDRTRTILFRFRLHDETQAKIAAEHGISVSAVEKHLAKAYRALARARSIFDGGGTLLRHLSNDDDPWGA